MYSFAGSLENTYDMHNAFGQAQSVCRCLAIQIWGACRAAQGAQSREEAVYPPGLQLAQLRLQAS